MTATADAISTLQSVCSNFGRLIGYVEEGRLTDTVFVRSTDGEALLTLKQAGEAYRAARDGDPDRMRLAVLPLARVADEHEIGGLKFIGADGNVLVATTDGVPLIVLSDVFEAQRSLQAL